MERLSHITHRTAIDHPSNNKERHHVHDDDHHLHHEEHLEHHELSALHPDQKHLLETPVLAQHSIANGPIAVAPSQSKSSVSKSSVSKSSVLETGVLKKGHAKDHEKEHDEDDHDNELKLPTPAAKGGTDIEPLEPRVQKIQNMLHVVEKHLDEQVGNAYLLTASLSEITNQILDMPWIIPSLYLLLSLLSLLSSLQAQTATSPLPDTHPFVSPEEEGKAGPKLKDSLKDNPGKGISYNMHRYKRPLLVEKTTDYSTRRVDYSVVTTLFYWIDAIVLTQ